MRLVCIYGPPAVGKLTVANELAKITEFKLLHNHLTFDLVHSIFDTIDDFFWKLVEKYRFDLINVAIEKNIKGLIITHVYAKPNNDRNIRKLVKIVENSGGEVLFVQLHCDQQELRKRLKHDSRKQFRKMKKVKTLKEIMKKYDLCSAVPHHKNIKIDNTKISPKKTAQIIKDHYQL
jgi:deoxyadenosine/deoxycytidine kinase